MHKRQFIIKIVFISFCFVNASTVSLSQEMVVKPIQSEILSLAQKEIINLSKEKWLWMADKNIDKLEPLFHDQSKFVHMSGSWKKAEELNIIKSGRIWYKKAVVHDVAAEVIDKTALVWSRITLTADVGGTEVVTEFTVTEAYNKKRNVWKLLTLTFSSVRDTHKIVH